MLFNEREIALKNGKQAIVRNVVPSDAAELLEFLKRASAETPFLLNEPEEITFTISQEEDFINGRLHSENELMLIALIDDKIAGICAFSPIANKIRYLHRCSVSIAVSKKYFGLGLGKAIFSILLDNARDYGFEQAELEVVASNTRAINLYESFGFSQYGIMKNNMKYKDGTYADAIYMIKYF